MMKMETSLINNWTKKLIYPVMISLIMITICIALVVVGLYFFTMFIAERLGNFVKEVPPYQATLAGVTTIAMTYIIKKFK